MSPRAGGKPASPHAAAPLTRRELQRIADEILDRLSTEAPDELLRRFGTVPPPTRPDTDHLTGKEFEYGVIAVEDANRDVRLVVFASLTAADTAAAKRNSLRARILGVPMGRSGVTVSRSPDP